MQQDEAGIVPNNPYPQSGAATIDAPAFNKSETQLKLEAKSVKNTWQAWNICKGLEYNNRQRSLRTADMQALHDGAPPQNASTQAEKAKSWQANTSTLWLAGIVGRVSQRFVNAIISQTYVTSSALPSTIEDAKTKSDLLREKFTSLVRGWDGNTGLINATAVETTLQGYCYQVFLDPTTWHPTFFKQDELFVPEKSGQHARDLQFFACKRDYRLDTFINLFRDEKAAEDVGYNLENCMEAANMAVMKDPRDEAATTQFRKFADMIDEGSVGIAVTGSGERVVKTWMLFNREYDGQISFWLIQRDTGKLLRFSFKEFRRMQDVMAMFSFEAGNGCIHSSKGLGRKLASLAMMKELFRCGIIDNSRISGLMIARVPSAAKNKFMPVMMSPFIVIDDTIQLAEQQFQTSAESYKIVDLLIDSWAEQAVGAYLTAQITDQGKTERTATEATIDARRESEAADIMIRRWLDQDANRVQMQQLRVCTDENIGRAKRIYETIVAEGITDFESLFPEDVDEANLMRFLVESLLAGITPEEIKAWSKSPSSLFAHVTESAVQRGVAAAKQVFTGNPNINQQALDYTALEGLVGAEMAKRLFVPGGENTIQIEAERMQQQESLQMSASGLGIKVSPRDAHLWHAAVIVSLLQNVLGPQLSSASATDATIKATELNFNHLGAHLQAGAAQGMNKLPQFKEYEKFYESFKKQFEEVIAIRQEAAVAQQMAAAQVRSESPAALPLGAGSPGAIAPAGQESLDSNAAPAEVAAA